MVSVPEGLTLGASGLVSRQMKRGDRGSVPASRTFAEMFECEATADAKCLLQGAVASFGSCAVANGWTKKSDVELVEALHETDNDE
jgi:hypothetical protein